MTQEFRTFAARMTIGVLCVVTGVVFDMHLLMMLGAYLFGFAAASQPSK